MYSNVWSLLTDTAVPVRRNGNIQTPISVPAVRPKQCHTLSNPAHRQDYTVACLNYTLQTMMPLPGWPAMVPKCLRQQQQQLIDNSQVMLTSVLSLLCIVLLHCAISSSCFFRFGGRHRPTNIKQCQSVSLEMIMQFSVVMVTEFPPLPRGFCVLGCLSGCCFPKTARIIVT